MRIIPINTISSMGDAMKARNLAGLMLVCGLLLGAAAAQAQDAEVRLVIKDHKFVPAELKVPANKKVKLVIENQDATAEEFESYELNREKVVPPKGQVTVLVGPL